MDEFETSFNSIKKIILDIENDVKSFSVNGKVSNQIKTLIETDILALFIVKYKFPTTIESKFECDNVLSKEERVLEWIKAKGDVNCFNKINLDFAIANPLCLDEGIIKWRASKEIKDGEEVLNIPSRLILSVPTMLHYSQNKKLLAEIYLVARSRLKLNEEENVNEFLRNVFAVFIMIETASLSSIYRPYFDTISPSESPLFWDDDQFNKLQGYTKNHFIQKKQNILSHYLENILPIFDILFQKNSNLYSCCTVEKFSIASSLISSRAFISQHITCLVPLADMLPHANDDQVLGGSRFEYELQKGFSLIANARVKQGSVLYCSRPGLTSLETLLHDKVTFVKRPKSRISYLSDVVTYLFVPTDLEPDLNLYDAKNDLFIALQINPSTLLLDTHVDTNFQKTMKLMRIYALSVSDFVCSKKPYILESLFLNKRISLPNERVAAQLVLQSISHTLEMYPTSFEEDKGEFVSDLNDDSYPLFTALLFRLSEKKILLDLKAKMEFHLKDLNYERKSAIAERLAVNLNKNNLNYHANTNHKREAVFEMYKRDTVNEFVRPNKMILDGINNTLNEKEREIEESLEGESEEEHQGEVQDEVFFRIERSVPNLEEETSDENETSSEEISDGENNSS
jgi:hypothetical protein